MSYDNILATASFADAEARAECERRLADAMAKPAWRFARSSTPVSEDAMKALTGSLQQQLDFVVALETTIRTQSKRIAELERERNNAMDGFKFANETTDRAISRAEAAEVELKRTREALEIAREYLDKKLDYNSAPFGDYVPNDAMRCLQEINEAMEKR
jgi:hypothetical protein